MNHDTERRLRELEASLLDDRDATRVPRHEAFAEIGVALRDILDAPSCRVGGDPPVPGVGWGVQCAAGAGPSVNFVYLAVAVSVRAGDQSWAVFLNDAHRSLVNRGHVAALYLPGAPADRPCWRRE